MPQTEHQLEFDLDEQNNEVPDIWGYIHKKLDEGRRVLPPDMVREYLGGMNPEDIPDAPGLLEENSK